MIRCPTSFKRMALLALWAAMLMSAMPTLSRVVASTAATTAPVLAQMCTAMGTQVMDISSHLAPEKRPAPPAGLMSDVCGYCVLVPPLLVALLLLCAVALVAAHPPAARCPSGFTRSLRNLRGLGSRAPPLAV